MGTRFYLVDDEPAVGRVVKAVLARAGIDAVLETDSARAAERLPAEKFDAVFLDVHMPAPDGLQLARLLRSGGFNMHTPIVMMTGDEDPGVMNRGYEAGSNFFLFKPLDRRRILRFVKASEGFILREQRRFRRILLALPLAMETENGTVHATTEDISLNGLLARVSRPVPTGSAVRLSVFPPGTDVITIEARALRMVGRDRLACIFEGMSREDNDALHRLLIPLIR
jgi:DNA-binding response OmpR family regulator